MIKRLLSIVVLATCLVLGANAQNSATILKSGSKAPAFTITCADGSNISLKDFKGKYLVIDFWASWCKDCRAEFSAVKKLYDEYQDKIAFLGVSFDTDEQAWKKCVSENELLWLQASELKKMKESEIGKSYSIGWIPTLYLISPKGKVVGGAFTVEEFEKILKSQKIK